MEGQGGGVPSLFTAGLTQILTVGILFFALVNGQHELALLALLVLAVVGGTRLWSRQSLRGLSCHLSVDKARVFPGEPVTLNVSAENVKILPIWLELVVPVGNMLGSSSGETILTKASSLLWYQKTRFQWAMTAGRRGVYQIGPLDITAGDLFSFFPRNKRQGESFSVLVYPALAQLNPFSLPRRDFFGVPRAKSPIQDPIYILGTRDYQATQPAKFIHWKASARHDRLQEKVFESTVQEKVLLAIDVDSFTRRGAEEEFEKTLEVVAALAVRFDRQGNAVGLAANGAVQGSGSVLVPVARNIQQIPDILEALARLQFQTEGEIVDRLRNPRALVWGATCAFFSFTVDESVWLAREFLAMRRTPVRFFVSRLEPATGQPRLNIRSRVYTLDEICAHKVESA